MIFKPTYKYKFLLASMLFACIGKHPLNASEYDKSHWQSLFNGNNLEGWTPKFTNEDVGINYKNTFQVKDGILIVSYDEYETFNDKFGHLFYNIPYSHYRLRLQYRFVGKQIDGGPAWAFENNGVMVHSENPQFMSVDKRFPASIEMQLLSGQGKDGAPRSTGNMCSPDSHIVLNGKLETTHCINSTSDSYPSSQWVTAEIEVLGNDSIKHFINGKEVLAYTQPQLDAEFSATLIEKNGTPMLSEGFIAIQAESHPTEFKSIEILVLDNNLVLDNKQEDK